jgi:hypothetical protein
MAGKKIPVTASPDTWSRLDLLLKTVRACISPMAARALDRSTICHQAIRDLLDKYESDPAALATKLGFSAQAPK